MYSSILQSKAPCLNFEIKFIENNIAKDLTLLKSITFDFDSHRLNIKFKLFLLCRQVCKRKAN